MRTVSALEVRKRFGQLVDEAAAGERLIIERAGQPVAAIVPLSDVPELNRDMKIKRQLRALDDLRRLSREHPIHLTDTGAADIIRRDRDDRAPKIWRAIDSWRSTHE